MGVKNYEMEASLLFTLAQLRGIRAGCICAAFANRKQGAFVDSDLKHKAEVRSRLPPFACHLLSSAGFSHQCRS